MGLLGVTVYDCVILVWAQVTYFQSQETNCIDTVPVLYFWLMAQIMFFYVVMTYVLCYMCRKYCQDPALRKKQELATADELKHAFEPTTPQGSERNDADLAATPSKAKQLHGPSVVEGVPVADNEAPQNTPQK